MCVGLVSSGQCLDVEFLHEQIWFNVVPNASGKLEIIEVYDILIKNSQPNTQLEEVLAIFPHDCTFLKTIMPSVPGDYSELEQTWNNDDPSISLSGNIIQIQPVCLSEQMPEEFDKYNWPFTDFLLDDERFLTWLPVEETIPQRNINNDKSFYRGKPLEIQVDFLEEFKSNTSYLKLISETKKTLVRLKLTPFLNSKEKGWFRLIVKPVHRKSENPHRKKVPCMPHPISFMEKKETTCPLIVKSELLLDLKKLYRKGDDKPYVMNNTLPLLELLCEKFQKPGTSTRVKDHRIALVTTSMEMDISQASSTEGMDFFGETTLKDKNHQALLWCGGAGRNINYDLIHNAQRIIDKLENRKHRNMPATDLVRELAPPEKNEAFWFLIKQMERTRLLIEHEGLLRLDDYEFDLGREGRFCDLRAIYSVGDVPKEKMGLLKEFKELHPFRINYRISWDNTNDDIQRWWGEGGIRFKNSQ